MSPEPGPAGASDAGMAALAAASFSLALGIAGTAVPLLALAAGYSATEVGLLVAISAVSQLAGRLFMGRLMRLRPDREFVVGASVSLAGSCGLLLWSTGWVPFLTCQLIQGVARALFWTGSQTHAVRTATTSVRGLARINAVSGVGLIAGPLIAGGLADWSLPGVMGLAAAVALLGAVPAARLLRLDPFVRPASGQPDLRMWRRPGVAVSCWAGAGAGAWRSLVGSYVPVVLDQARQSAPTIGVLVAVANAASLVGGGAAGWLRGVWVSRSLALGVLAAAAGTVATAAWPGHAPGAALALAVSGLGAGVLQTVGPAVASDAVGPELRGEAIAASGSFRAAALFVVPFGVAGLVLLVPVGPALAVAGVLMGAPALGMVALRRAGAAAAPSGRGGSP